MSRNETYRLILNFYFTDYIFKIPSHERKKFISSGFLGTLKSIAVILYLNQKRYCKAKNLMQAPLHSKPWVFCIGKNNYEATSFLKDEGFSFTTDRNRPFQAEAMIFELPIQISVWSYFHYFPLLLYLLRKEGRRTLSIADAVFASLGWYEAFIKTIRHFKPSAIIFSNDHSMLPRALFYAAKHCHVPTIYIQHASVSRYMPALDFDLSLLDGEDSLTKYRLKGIKGITKLTGMPKFDAYLRYRKAAPPDTIKTVGVAFNTVDSLDRIREVILLLIAEPDFARINLRAHPKDTRDYQPMFRDLDSRIHFSDPLHERSFEFILTCDIILAGDSAIHLESKMLNIDSVYYNFSEGSGTYDLYGYIARGFVREAATAGEIVNEIKSASTDPQLFLTTQYYNAAIHPSETISSRGLAAQEIRKFLGSRSLIL